MENNSKIKQWANRITDKIQDQAWFQQLRAKWEEVDPKNRTQIKVAGIIGVSLLALVLSFNSIFGVRKVKKELTDKTDLLNMLQSANEEIKKLQDLSAGNGSKDEGGAWSGYFESLGAKVGLEKTSLTVTPETQGVASPLASESLMDVTLKHVNVKQVVQYAFMLETGSRIVKIRNFKVSADPDLSGYLDSTFSVSGFALKNKEGT